MSGGGVLNPVKNINPIKAVTNSFSVPAGAMNSIGGKASPLRNINPINAVSNSLSTVGTIGRGLMSVEKRVDPLAKAKTRALTGVNSTIMPYTPRPLKPLLNSDTSSIGGGAVAVSQGFEDVTGRTQYQTPDEVAANQAQADENRRVEGVRQGATNRILGASRRRSGDSLAGSSDLANQGTDLPQLTPEEAALSPELAAADQQNAVLSSIAGARKADILQRRRQPGRSATILSKGNQ